MGELKTVGVKELKNNLSAYLRDVRRGTRVLVSDRNRVIAELHEPAAGYALDDPIHPKLAEWIEARVVAPPSTEKVELPPSPVSVEEGTAEALLDAERGDPAG